MPVFADCLNKKLGCLLHLEAEAVRLRFGENLHPQFPLGIIARLYGFPQVAPMKVTVRALNLGRFVQRRTR